MADDDKKQEPEKKADDVKPTVVKPPETIIRIETHSDQSGDRQTKKETGGEDKS